MAAAKAGGVGMYFESAQHPTQNLPLDAFELRYRGENFSHAFAALGDLKLNISDQDGGKLGRRHFQALGELLDAPAGLFFARARRRTAKPVEKSHRMSPPREQDVRHSRTYRRRGGVRKKRARAETRAHATLR